VQTARRRGGWRDAGGESGAPYRREIRCGTYNTIQPKHNFTFYTGTGSLALWLCFMFLSFVAAAAGPGRPGVNLGFLAGPADTDID
jgi:hypothetical protein